MFSNEGFVGRHVTPVPTAHFVLDSATRGIHAPHRGVRAWSARRIALGTLSRREGSHPSGDSNSGRGSSVQQASRPINACKRPAYPLVDECPRSFFTRTVLHHLLRDSKTAPVRAACLPDTSPRRDGGFSAFGASRAVSYSPGLLAGSFSTRNQRRNLATRLLIAAPHSSYRTKARTNSRCDGPVEQLKREC